jgi:hypothetical protein
VQFRLSEVGDHLTLHYGEQPPLPILPLSDVEFFSRATNTQIRFDKDDKAAITALTINQGGSQIKADKQGM